MANVRKIVHQNDMKQLVELETWEAYLKDMLKGVGRRIRHLNYKLKAELEAGFPFERGALRAEMKKVRNKEKVVIV